MVTQNKGQESTQQYSNVLIHSSIFSTNPLNSHIYHSKLNIAIRQTAEESAPWDGKMILKQWSCLDDIFECGPTQAYREATLDIYHIYKELGAYINM